MTSQMTTKIVLSYALAMILLGLAFVLCLVNITGIIMFGYRRLPIHLFRHFAVGCIVTAHNVTN